MDEEIKEVGEMATIEGEEEITINEDYTTLEAETIIIDDDSNIQTDAEYEQAVEQKELADEAREALSAVLLSVLEKGEINDDDIAEIAAQQEIYTENVTALKILGIETEDEKSTTNVITSNIDYNELMKVLSEKADWLYTDEDGQVMLNGEVVPKLKVVELEAEKVKADVGEFKDLTTENFTAVNARIDNLNVGDLTAVNADITNLKAVVAEIQTLIGGNLTMDNIQSLVLTADKVTIADALIKNAMIDSISANKIDSGTINTNNVNIQSADGSMVINGTTQQFRDKNGVVRIQIGKDMQGNFTFALFSQDGQGILIDETGIKAGAVPDQIITNDMVSDNANISGGKLDISSVISSINDNTTTINSSKIKFNDTEQTLDIAFNQLKNKVETIENVTIDGDLSSIIEQVNTNTTNISIAQGQISSLISNTTITKQDGTVIQLKDDYNSTKDTVNSHEQTIGSLQTNVNDVVSKQSSLEQNLNGFKQTVSETYTTKADFNNLSVGGTNLQRFSSPYLLKGKNILDYWDDSRGTISHSSDETMGDDCYCLAVNIGQSNCYAQQLSKYRYFDIIEGEKYSYSMDYLVGDNSKGIRVKIYNNGDTKNYTLFEDSKTTTGQTDKIHSEGTWTATWTGKAYVCIFNLGFIDTAGGASNLLFNNIKIEKGSIPTSWSPAPQDINANIDFVSDDLNANYSTTTQMNSAINQKANEITTSVSETYATQTTTNSMLSQIQQNANSISTKVDVNGVISSINQSSETIAINANKINLNGYVSNDNANWSIDNEGNMRAENLKIEGDVGADTLSVNYIDNPCYPATLAGSVHLYVNASSGNDDYTIDDILQSYDEAEEQSNDSLKKKFKTLQGALDASPAFLNNKNLRITLETDTTEDVYVRGFTSGAVRIYLNGYTIYGNVHGYANSATVYLYGGTVDDTTATQGVIHPNIGFNIGSRCVSAGFEACQYVALYKVKVFGADNKPSDISSDYKVAVASSAGTGSIYCSDVQITNCAIGFRTNNMGCIHAAKSSGKASRYGFESTTGGQISIADANQAGGTTANTSESSGGQVWYKSPTFDGNTTSTDTTTAPVVSTTKTMVIKSTYGDTYRSSVYNNWKKDGTVRQGDYGYGDCTGCWFFGTAFSELKGKTISKVQITITRNSGGSSVPVEHKLWMHRYTSRPSGAPTLTSNWSQTFRLATGNSTTVAITNSTVLNAISAGTCKGFALRHTYDSAHYSVCSGNVTVKITYTE